MSRESVTERAKEIVKEKGLKPGEALALARDEAESTEAMARFNSQDHEDDIRELSKRIGKYVRISSARLVIEGTLLKVDQGRVKVWIREKSKTRPGTTLTTSVRLSKSSNVSWEE